MSLMNGVVSRNAVTCASLVTEGTIREGNLCDSSVIEREDMTGVEQSNTEHTL